MTRFNNQKIFYGSLFLSDNGSRGSRTVL